MSARRCPQQETWDDNPPRPGRCRNRLCDKAPEGRRTSWCSAECQREVTLRVHWPAIRAAILRRDAHRCQLCGGPGWEVDHVVELADGGSFHDPDNLRTLCTPCHQAKTARALRARRGLPEPPAPKPPTAQEARDRQARRRHGRRARDWRGKRRARARANGQGDE